MDLAKTRPETFKFFLLGAAYIRDFMAVTFKAYCVPIVCLLVC